jgi:DNA-binding winged helix-turn-helix (wHTH) protein
VYNQLHRNIIDQVLKTEERKSEAFRTLRKALGHTLSVVVCAVPKAGFEFMAQLNVQPTPDHQALYPPRPARPFDRAQGKAGVASAID